MTYINKGTKVFMVAQENIIVPVRSEARMKNYFSTTDARAWSDIVEERRQYILEYTAKNKEGFCLDKFIPLEIIFNTMMAGKNIEIKRLQKKLRCLEKCINIYTKIELTPEQRRQLKILRAAMEKTCGRLECLQRVTLNNMFGACRRQFAGECSDIKPSSCSKCSKCPISQNTVKGRYYTADNAIVKNSHQEKLCVPFPRSSYTCCTEKLTNGKTQVLIAEALKNCYAEELKNNQTQVFMGEPKKDCCTETDICEICNGAKETRCTCTDTCCKDALIETINECAILMSQHSQLECCDQCCNCNQPLPCNIMCPHEEEYEIEVDQCCLHPENLEHVDCCLNDTEDLNTCQTMIIMKHELEAIRLENKKQLELASKMMAPEDHEQLQNIYNQCEYVKCISEQLEKQYQQWNQMRCQQQSNDVCARVCCDVCCHCNLRSIEFPDLTDSECSIDLEEELEAIEKEKEKLIELVREIQQGAISDSLLDCLKSDNMKLQEQLEKEIIYRKYLERTLLNVLN